MDGRRTRTFRPRPLHAGAADRRRSRGDSAQRCPWPVDGRCARADRRGLRRGAAAREKRPAHRLGADYPDAFPVAVLGKGSGNPRRRARLPEVRQAHLGLPRVCGRAGVLPRDRGRQDLSRADGQPRRDRHRDLRSVSEGHAGQGGRTSRLRENRRVQDRAQPVDADHLHPGASRDDRVAVARYVRAARARHRRDAEEESGRRADAD